MISQLSPHEIEPINQLEAWNGIMARNGRWQLGSAVLTRPVSSPAVVERNHGPAQRPVSRTLRVHIFQSGSGRLLHRGRELPLRQGDLVACAGEENYRFEMQGNHEILIVELDPASLSGPVEWIDEVIGQVIPRETTEVRLLHDFLLSLWREKDTLDGSAPCDTFSKVLGDMVLASLKPVSFQRSVDQAPLWQRAKAIIAARAGDSRLTPASLAAELGVGLRSLQVALASHGTTPGAYITEKRLQLAQQCLLARRTMSITQIAFDCGFEDSGYFSRRFRQRFGMSPAQFRLAN